jgi:hypothetical protein
MKRKCRRIRPQIEGMEQRDVPTGLGSIRASAIRRTPLPRQWQPQSIRGTGFGAMIDTGPGTVKLDTARPPFNLFNSNNWNTVFGQLDRDVATNKVNGWLVVGVSGGRQVRLEVTGNAANTSLLGKMVNLRFTGSGEFANSIRPGNIRLMLNTPIRGRYSITFA